MRRSSSVRGGRASDRGATSPVALILVIGMVLAATFMLLTLGASAVQDTQNRLADGRAEKVMTQLDSQAALVALGNSRVQAVPLPGSDGARYGVDGDAGWMRVSVTNVTDGTSDTIMNETLGEVRYRDGRGTVAYQGGGVWRRTADGSVMVSPPEFYYRDATLTLPLVTLDGPATLEGRAVVERSGQSVQHFPDPAEDANYTNPLTSGRVSVTVHSDYYRAWGQYFETRTDGKATFDHDDETVTLTLVVPAGKQRVTSAVAATSAAGEISLSGSGSDTTRTDSYDSSEGDGTYADTKTDDGTVATAGDVSVKGNSIVEGSVRSGGYVSVKGSGEVVHDVYYAEGAHIKGTVGGTVEQIEGVEGAGPIDSVVASRYQAINETNDNADADNVTGDALKDGDVALGPGRYHLDELVLDGETLTLNTTDDGETIELAVREHVRLLNGARVEVEGTGRVRVYVEGRETGAEGHHFSIDDSGGVVNVSSGEQADRFWIYGRSDFSGALDGTSSDTVRFEGVLYAPGGEVGASSVRIEKADLFGGVVAGSVEVDNGGAIHYDASLHDVRAIPESASIVRLTYLHVSSNPVSVTSR